MPLVIICGLPLSGKSRLSCLLKEYFSRTIAAKVLMISDEQKLEENKRNILYGKSFLEKQLRSWLKSEVERHLIGDNLIILDANNYIKGFRYELFCASKERKTTHCLIELNVSPEIAWNRNSSADTSKDVYNRETFDALVQRYERPEPNNRWDSPLITIADIDGNIPFEEITAALYQRKAPKPNQSTQSPPLSSTNFLYDLDSKTQQVVRDVFESVQSGRLKEAVIPDSRERLNVNKVVSIAQLNKLRRLFIGYAKSHPISENQTIATLFVQFINKSV